MTFNSLLTYIDESNQAVYVTGTFYPTAGRIIIACISMINSEDTLDSVIGSQYTWNKLTSIRFDGDGGGGYGYSGLSVWWSYSESGNSDTLTITPTTGMTPDCCIVSVFEIANSFGKNCLTPRQCTTNKSNSSTFQTTFNSNKIQSNGAFSVVSVLAKISGYTVPSSYSLINTINGSLNDLGIITAGDDSGSTGTSVQWTNSNSGNYGMITVEVWNPHIITGTAYSSPMTY